MDNLSRIFKKECFPISLILILAFARLIPHPPNFTPIIAVAIMSSYFFRNIYLSFVVIIISMLLADIFIGFYGHIFFVYLSLLLITAVFTQIGRTIKIGNLFIFGFFGSLIFYLVSNFGVWALSGMYEQNLVGLVECYILALPFFTNTFLSTIFFSYAVFFVSNFYIKKSI